MGVDAMVRGLDELTAQDLRERGSLKWTAHGGDMIGAFVAEMDFGPPPAVTRALHTAVTRGNLSYLPPWLAAEVAEACAQWQLHRYGWRVAPELVRPVADVLTAFELVVRHYTRPDSPIVLPTPAYMPFLTVPSLLGRRVIQVPMIREAGRYVLDLGGIDRAFAPGGPRGGGAGRRSGPRRRGPRPVHGPGAPARPVRGDLAGRRRPQHHRHLGVQGLEPGGAQVRAGHPHRARRRRHLATGGHHRI